MKKTLYTLLVLQMFCTGLLSQNENLKTGYLPVFIVIDEGASAILDNFIMEAQNYISRYPSVTFSMSIGLHDNNDIPFSLTLDLNKQKNSPDSIILHKHPNCRQILVSHKGYLFETTICKYPDFDNEIHFPTAVLKKTRKKHKVYYKKTPRNYFIDNPTKGEVIYENQLLGWSYHYCDGHWQEDAKISY